MRVLYQPTQATPGGWQETQADQWASLGPFTCHALCVQGVVFDGADHYSVEQVSPGVVRVVVWYDDPTDWPPGSRWAREFTLRHLAQDQSPQFGGAIRPRHTQVIYAETTIRPLFDAAYDKVLDVSVRPWSAFRSDLLPNPRDGQWVSDAQHEAHQAAQTIEGWRTWTEGLDPSELDANGQVKVQRAIGRFEVPKGTRTYYHNAVSATTPQAADFQNQIGLSPAGSTNQVSGSIGSGGRLVWSTITPAGDPGTTAWPTTGTYRYQLDVISAGVDLTFGLLTQGTSLGRFARINSAGDTNLQTFVQSQAAFFSSGLHIATIVNPAWTSGSSADRFGFTVAAVRVTGHGTQTMTLQVGESDDFTDGPWPAFVPPLRNATFFGSHF